MDGAIFKIPFFFFTAGGLTAFMTNRAPIFLNVFFADCLYPKNAFDGCARIDFFIGVLCRISQQLK
jgi:hypothetical protein